MKAMCEKGIANIILCNERLKAFPLRSEKRQGCQFLLLLFNIVLEILARPMRQEKLIKGISWKQRTQIIPVFR